MTKFVSVSVVIASLALLGCGQIEADQSQPEESASQETTAIHEGLICQTCGDTGDPTPPPPPTVYLPDFVILSSYVVKYNSSQGYYTITFTIKNAGNTSGFCGATYVSIQKDDGTSLMYWNALTGTTLAPGATKTVETPIGVNSPWVAGPGNLAGAPYIGDPTIHPNPYKVVMKVDTWNQTVESYESNNSRTFDL